MGRAKFTPTPGLDHLVAALFAKPAVERVVAEVQAEAKKNAPPTKRWVSMDDGGVRRQHVLAHGQEAVDSLPFVLTSYEWDVQHRHAVVDVVKRGDGSGWDGPDAKLVNGHHTYLMYPRDTTPGAYVAVVNCRCMSHPIPDGISKLVKRTPVTVVGTKVAGKVYADGKLAVEAEYGQLFFEGIGEHNYMGQGASYMHRAVWTVRNRHRARR